MNILYEVEGKTFSSKREATEYEEKLALSRARFKVGDEVLADDSSYNKACVALVTIEGVEAVYDNEKGAYNLRYDTAKRRVWEESVYKDLNEFMVRAMQRGGMASRNG